MRKCGSSVSLSASCVYMGIVQITFGSEDTPPQFSNKCDHVYTPKFEKHVRLSIHIFIGFGRWTQAYVPTQTHTHSIMGVHKSFRETEQRRWCFKTRRAYRNPTRSALCSTLGSLLLGNIYYV